MRERRFADFLTRSFVTLERELPRIHERLCRHFAGHTVAIHVDGETVPLSFTARRVFFQHGGSSHVVRIVTGRSTILDLVDARRSLVDAVLGDQLQLLGSPDDLLHFHDGLMIYLHGAVRAPGFPSILRNYRNWQMPPAGLDPTGQADKEVAA